MAIKTEYLLIGLSIVLVLAIVCTIVVTTNIPQKEQQVTEPVIMAIVEDSRMLQSLPPPVAEPPKILVKPMPAKVSIPTDESIDEAIFIVSKTANANYENFVNAVPPNTAPSVPAAQNPATSVPAAQHTTHHTPHSARTSHTHHTHHTHTYLYNTHTSKYL